jgi:hypothetical protein
MEHRLGVEVTPAEVLDEMNRIEESREFRASKRCFEFLHYVVERKLNGQLETLKERVIGMELFGRPVSYEPSEDATVRVKAGQVRKRLHDFYASEGMFNPIRIDLPQGSYVPLFRYLDQTHTALSLPPKPDADTLTEVVLGEQNKAPNWASFLHSWKWRIGISIALLTIVIGYLSVFRSGHPASTPADQFWAPLVSGGNPVWLCASAVPVFTQKQDPPNTLDDMVLIRDQFVAVSDLNAVTHISEMLTQMKHPYRLRVGAELSYHDLQTAPAIFVGYSYSRWNEISRQLRFSLTGNAVLENGHPTEWKLSSSYAADPQLTQDYALISRFFDPNTHNVLVEIAGISHYGTEAAADVASNTALFSEILRELPPGWQNKNIQILLRVNIVHGAPGVPVPVVTHVW